MNKYLHHFLTSLKNWLESKSSAIPVSSSGSLPFPSYASDATPSIAHTTPEASKRNCMQHLCSEIDFMIEKNKTEPLLNCLKKGYVLSQAQFLECLSRRSILNAFNSDKIIKSCVTGQHTEFINTHCHHLFGEEALVAAEKINHLVAQYHDEQSLNAEKNADLSLEEAVELTLIQPQGRSHEMRDYVEEIEKKLELAALLLEHFAHSYTCESLEVYHTHRKNLERLQHAINQSSDIFADAQHYYRYHFRDFSPCPSLMAQHSKLYDSVSLIFLQPKKIATAANVNTTATPQNALYATTSILSHAPTMMSVDSYLQSILSPLSTPSSLRIIPENAKQILKNIHTHAHTLLSQSPQTSDERQALSSFLDADEKLYLQDTLQTDIPQILKEYCALRPETLQKMKTSDNKSMLDLLLESLSAIETKLQELIDQNEKQKVKSLTVTHRYMRAKC